METLTRENELRQIVAEADRERAEADAKEQAELDAMNKAAVEWSRRKTLWAAAHQLRGDKLKAHSDAVMALRRFLGQERS